MRSEGGSGHKSMQRIIEVCLLVMLCGPDIEHCHGYALGERLREFGFDDSEISVSTLYRTLRGMEEAGWVTSGWAAGGPGPQRREYAVTDAGRAALDEWAAVLQKRRDRITRVLEAYALLGREPSADVSEEALIARTRLSGIGRGAHHRQSVNKTAPKTHDAEQPDIQPAAAVQKETGAAGRREAENLHEYWD